MSDTAVVKLPQPGSNLGDESLNLVPGPLGAEVFDQILTVEILLKPSDCDDRRTELNHCRVKFDDVTTDNLGQDLRLPSRTLQRMRASGRVDQNDLQDAVTGWSDGFGHCLLPTIIQPAHIGGPKVDGRLCQ